LLKCFSVTLKDTYSKLVKYQFFYSFFSIYRILFIENYITLLCKIYLKFF
uniref:Ovule protein n=1 Tax=Parastrongyloides trichosuri TaxID=131310 RepID=A0A0N4YZY6_PARTI